MQMGIPAQIDPPGYRRCQSFEVRGANVKPMSAYPLSKTENSPELVHNFLGGAQIHIKKIHKCHAW